MQVEQLFPTHLATYQVPDAQVLNEALLRDVEQIRNSVPNQKPEGLGSNFYTTFPHKGDLHRHYQSFARLGNVVAEQCAGFGTYMGVTANAAVPVVPVGTMTRLPAKL